MKININMNVCSVVFFLNVLLLDVSGVTNVTEKTENKNIEEVLSVFRANKEIHVLDPIIDALDCMQSGTNYEHAGNIRAIKAEKCVKILKDIQGAIDPEYSAKKYPCSINIRVPGDKYPAGSDPDSIKEPEIREAYKQALAKNRANIEKSNKEGDLRSAERRVLNILEDALIDMRRQSPNASNEVMHYLNQITLSAEERTMMLNKILRKIER